MIHSIYDEEGRLLAEYDDPIQVYREFAEDGTVTLERPYNDEERDAKADRDASRRAAFENEHTLRARARNAIQANNQFLNLNAPTQAQALQQIKALTRQMNGLARILAQELDYID